MLDTMRGRILAQKHLGIRENKGWLRCTVGGGLGINQRGMEWGNRIVRCREGKGRVGGIQQQCVSGLAVRAASCLRMCRLDMWHRHISTLPRRLHSRYTSGTSGDAHGGATVLELADGHRLSQDVSNHRVGGDVAEVDFSTGDTLASKVMNDVDVFGAEGDDRVLEHVDGGLAV